MHSFISPSNRKRFSSESENASPRPHTNKRICALYNLATKQIRRKIPTEQRTTPICFRTCFFAASILKISNCTASQHDAPQHTACNSLSFSRQVGNAFSNIYYTSIRAIPIFRFPSKYLKATKCMCDVHELSQPREQHSLLSRFVFVQNRDNRIY